MKGTKKRCGDNTLQLIRTAFIARQVAQITENKIVVLIGVEPYFLFRELRSFAPSCLI